MASYTKCEGKARVKLILASMPRLGPRYGIHGTEYRTDSITSDSGSHRSGSGRIYISSDSLIGPGDVGRARRSLAALEQ